MWRCTVCSLSTSENRRSLNLIRRVATVIETRSSGAELEVLAVTA